MILFHITFKKSRTQKLLFFLNSQNKWDENNLNISNLSIFLVDVNGSLVLESTKSEIKTFFFLFLFSLGFERVWFGE